MEKTLSRFRTGKTCHIPFLGIPFKYTSHPVLGIEGQDHGGNQD
jgi:hypothetical protein